jgi:hypothetical protein
MRGRKGSTHEGGLRSPFLIRYPAKIKSGTRVTTTSAAIDLLPTLADFAGISTAGSKPLDGTSIVPLLTGHGEDWPKRVLFSTWNGKTTIRTDRYRMQASGELFDIEADPRERFNLADEKPKLASRLRQQLNAWIAEVKPVKSKGDGKVRPITLADPRAEFHQLPSRDANGHGGVKRSNKFPNCTYMQNWTSTDDEITWDVDVLGDGRFEVQMYYACPADSVGATIQLSIGDENLTAKIDQANDSPLRGKEQDRVVRSEGYVRDWKAMTLGEINLRTGRASLSLRATEIPGEQVCEMRLLLFRKL